MSIAGVSRSGRVRKKSAKLIEMETKSDPPISPSVNHKNSIKLTPNAVNNNITIAFNDNSVEDIVDKSDSETTKPLNRKLKIKLSLNPSPVVKPEEKTSEELVINNSSVDETNSLPKKATIPPLKIPKSKITGLVPNITPEVVANNIQTSDLNSMTTPLTSGKTKKTKNQSNCKTEVIIESKGETNELIECNEEVIESIPEVVIDNPIEVMEESVVETIEKSIQETPKMTKVLKKEKKKEKKIVESAANRLFRQITSGVSVGKGKGNKRNQSLPLEDVTQNSFDDEFEETSLIIETDDSIKPKPKKRSRPTKPLTEIRSVTKKTKRVKNTSEDKPKKKKRVSVTTAYMIWSKEYRSKIQHNCPEMDFADISKKLGEIWHSMTEKDKIPWRRKAQKLVATGSSIISTGKPKAIPQTSKINNTLTAPVTVTPSLAITEDYSYTSIDDLWEPVGTDPIDVSSHLTLLGESLSIIGQRLKEHSGQIAVSGSLSVLLDSTLCAIGPMLCLTQLDPRLNGCPQEIHKKTLDNIAYIMPGI